MAHHIRRFQQLDLKFSVAGSEAAATRRLTSSNRKRTSLTAWRVNPVEVRILSSAPTTYGDFSGP